MARRDSKLTVAEFIEKHGDAITEMTGFYWCGPNAWGYSSEIGDYRCVVLARTAKPHQTTAGQFVGATPEDLIDAMAEAGIERQDPSEVAQLCESAPRSPRLRPRKRRTLSDRGSPNPTPSEES